MNESAQGPIALKPAKSRKRVHNADASRQNILDVATEEFARNGLSGSRIDEIAARTKTSKRMIYYHFGDKEGLYLAVLESVYRKIRALEATLDIEHLEPEKALKRLIEFTFDYQNNNEDFIRLVMIENIHHGAYLAKSKEIRKLNFKIIDSITALYSRGVEAGAFRTGLDPVDIHWFISALCFFNVSNRATFSNIFDIDMASAINTVARREAIVEMVTRFVLK
jgi:AcrR family transcriptional regulator